LAGNPQNTPSWTGKILPTSAALRSQPHKSARSPYQGIVADLPRGTEVTVICREGGWLQVEVRSGNRTLKGYVSRELVGRQEQPSAGPQASSAPRGDEVTPIAQYILREMRINAASLHARKIAQNNAQATQDCYAQYQKLPFLAKLFGGAQYLESCESGRYGLKVAALASWTLLVRENGAWDHKKYIRETFKPADPNAKEQHWHHYKGFVYFYDIWSNLHYGYVGKACGFTESELLDGAGLEQIGSDIVNGRVPSASPGVPGLRRFDNSSDRESVAMGIRLYPRMPSVVELLNLLEKTAGLTRRPLRR